MDLSRFTITGAAEQTKKLAEQNARIIRLRWLYVGLLGTVAYVSALLAMRPDDARTYLFIVAGGLALNSILWLVNRTLKHPLGLQILTIIQLFLDLVIISFVAYKQGGLNARAIILFALPITAAGLVFSRRIVYTTAALSGVGFVASVLFANFTTDKQVTVNESLVPLIFYPVFFIIYAKLVSFLMMANIDETREQAYDAFLALLTHQLKRPASTASSIIDQLERGEPKASEQRQHYIKILKSENQTLLQLLNNLLETASFTNFNDRQEEVELSRLLQRVAYDSAAAHGRESDLKLDIENMHISARGNSGRLYTVFSNVMNNAFQYSNAGSPVIVNAHTTGGNVVVSIEDSGSGISSEVKKKLFKKYTLQDNQDTGVKGLGLGLYVAKKIVEAYGGTLNIITNKLGTKVIIIIKKGNTHG